MTAPSIVVSSLFRLDFLACSMLVLVAGLGLVVWRYARSYLAGDAGIARCRRWLLTTLAAVMALVCANDLMVIALAWTAAGLALHPLLTHFPERTAARLAAHKKFLVGRLADLVLWPALGIVKASVGSLALDSLAAWVAAHPRLTPSMHLAAALIALAVVLRSAQLPFHGWLLQVMDAPTPVSALLHAGVVNVGGFVLLRLSPWLAQAPAARGLLVAFGLVTAATAGLVMMTRVSVKVALAWSTCAQMGFMLLEIGLGLWHLALLHLLAHSLYKAHAFLSAGAAVERWRRRALAATARPGWRARAAATSLLALAYAGAHALGGWLLPLPAALAHDGGAWALLALPLVAVLAVQRVLRGRPHGALARALHPWLFAGLHLDDHVSRWLFRAWPPRLHAARAPALRPPPALEVRA